MSQEANRKNEIDESFEDLQKRVVSQFQLSAGFARVEL